MESSAKLTTIRDYYEDSYKVNSGLTLVQYESTARVLDMWKGEKDSEFVVVLDRTIFHPQGGGQPADEGSIETGETKFTVKALQSKDDTILHMGTFSKVIFTSSYSIQEGDTFEKGTEVNLQVDGEKRRLYARFHSAGHLLDIAVRRCGQTQLSPGKGHHFPSGAYVEYIGVVDNAIKDKLVASITEAANNIIKEKRAAQDADLVWS